MSAATKANIEKAMSTATCQTKKAYIAGYIIGNLGILLVPTSNITKVTKIKTVTIAKGDMSAAEKILSDLEKYHDDFDVLGQYWSEKEIQFQDADNEVLSFAASTCI